MGFRILRKWAALVALFPALALAGEQIIYAEAGNTITRSDAKRGRSLPSWLKVPEVRMPETNLALAIPKSAHVVGNPHANKQVKPCPLDDGKWGFCEF